MIRGVRKASKRSTPSPRAKNVGDSRAYLFRDGRLQLLTRDQTQAQMLADAGVIEQSEVARDESGQYEVYVCGRFRM